MFVFYVREKYLLSECGISICERDRIYGGQTAQESSCIPWQVAIYNTKTDKLCGGSILSPKFVMSAGHCFYADMADEKKSYPIGGEDNRFPLSSIVILSGTTNLRDLTDPLVKKHRVQTIYEHENYRHFLSFSHDFAVLELADEITLGQNARAICLPEPQHQHDFDTGTEFLTSGWGATRPRIFEDGVGTTSLHLKYIRVPFVREDDCRSKWRKFLAIEPYIQQLLDPIDSSMICVGVSSLILDDSYYGSCKGDSGGKKIFSILGPQ